MRCVEMDNCQISDGECSEICRSYRTGGFIAGMATAAFVFALVGFFTYLIFT